MNISLYSEESGQGKPLILLHGNGEDGNYFSAQKSYFSKSFRVITVDTRGHGKSPRGDLPFTIRQFAADLYRFMREKSIEKADILGFSDGGNIALIFAIKYPEMVDRLILNGANLNSKGVKGSVQFPIVMGYKTASMFAKRSEKARRNAEMLGLMVNEPNINVEELKKVHARTLVIVGKNDMIKKKHTLLIFQNLPNAVLEIIDGNHFIAARNPEAFNATVDKFLSM